MYEQQGLEMTISSYATYPVHGCNRQCGSALGFTLVELGMVLVVVSFIIGPIFTYLTIQTDRDNYQETVTKQRRIAIALSDYAQLHGYLPCPSRAVEGVGVSASRTIGEEVPQCTSHELRSGIVPFRTLGLMPSDAVDGYGNLFSYAVSEAANHIPGSNPNIGGLPPALHTDCTVGPWNTSDEDIVKRDRHGATGVNALTDQAVLAASKWRKARFCCRQLGGGADMALDVFSNAERNLRPINTQGRLVNGTSAPMPSASVPNPLIDKQDLKYIAYVLISHGKNGRGSYRYGSPNAFPTTGAGAAEIVNATRNNTVDGFQFIDIPINRQSGNAYFDDIVLWRTQESVIAETGRNSCMIP